MKVIDPGHKYELATLDGGSGVVLTFVKREGTGYPGNVGHYPGTNIQETLRAQIDRVKYLNKQLPCSANVQVARRLRECLRYLEQRAALRHGRVIPVELFDEVDLIEHLPFCEKCGHVGCGGTCHGGGPIR